MSVSNIKNCYGCGVCASVCAKKAITLDLNKDGFYEPTVQKKFCNECGLCTKVCAFIHEDLASKNAVCHSYAAWSNTPSIRYRCSSGGAGYELGKYLLNSGYKACVVKYNISTKRAEHFIATNEKELMQSVGSKYIQSYTVSAFRNISRKDKYLVTGTPCQIDSFRRYIKLFNVEQNFVLMDFFCHSVPSLLAWNRYVFEIEKLIGPVVYASWRNKYTGWHDSWAMTLDGDKSTSTLSNTAAFQDYYDIYNKETKKCQYNSRLSQGDVFYKLFLGDFCCNPACEKNCKYKYEKSSADIRIGDLWGKEYANNEEGVSAIISFTDKGEDIIKSIDCELIEHPFNLVAEGQMKHNVGRAKTSFLIWKLLKMKKCPLGIFKIIFCIEYLISIPNKVFRKIINYKR